MPSDAGIVPCVVFAYKRPNKMERILAALQTQDIDRLIVFVDGPWSALLRRGICQNPNYWCRDNWPEPVSAPAPWPTWSPSAMPWRIV